MKTVHYFGVYKKNEIALNWLSEQHCEYLIPILTLLFEATNTPELCELDHTTKSIFIMSKTLFTALRYNKIL